MTANRDLFGIHMFTKTSNDLYYRSKERIKILGEVFTPEAYVLDMLDLLDKKVWKDENTVFFEPCCGHGNIVIPIFRKRMLLFNKKYQKEDQSKAPLFAVANAINTIWAIDIDSSNVAECRERVFTTAIQFMTDAMNADLIELIMKNRIFIVHLACAIVWQIHENETLSCLSDTNSSTANANKTKTGYSWFKKNGHKPINLKVSWCDYFIKCKKDNSTPILYERAIKAIDNIIHNKNIKVKELDFIMKTFESHIKSSTTKL